MRQYMLRRLRVVGMPDQGSLAMAVALTNSNVGADGRRDQKLIGRKATVVVNPDTGAIITAYRTKSRYRRKYERERHDE